MKGHILARAMMSQKRELAMGMLAGVGLAASSIGLAVSSSWLIVRASERPAVLSLTVAMGSVQLFALARSLLRYVERTQTHRAGLSIMAELRHDIASRLSALLPSGVGPRRFEVITAVLDDVGAAEALLTATLSPLVIGATTLIITAVVAQLVVGAGALTTLVLLTLGVVQPTIRVWLSARLDQAIDWTRNEQQKLVDEAVRDRFTRRTGGQWRALTMCLNELETERERMERRRALILGGIDSLSIGLGGALVGLLALRSLDLVAENLLGAAWVAVAPLTALASIDLLSGVSNALRSLRTQRHSLAHLESVVAAPVPIIEPVIDDPLPTKSSGSLRAKNMSVAYGAVPVVENVNFSVEPGDLCWIRGASGSGKTSLLFALSRFTPYSGSAQLNARELSSLRGATVRSAVGLVDDSPYIFAESLRANVLLARPDATDDEILSAMHQLGLAEFLMTLPEGLDTLMGGRSSGMSGGERRRIGLVRELLAERPVVILDEPLEGLDQATRNRVVHALQRLTTRASVVVSSHQSLEDVATSTIVVER